MKKSYGQIAFEAYRHFTELKTYDGKVIPEWKDLPPHVQAAWEEAADAAIDDWIGCNENAL